MTRSNTRTYDKFLSLFIDEENDKGAVLKHDNLIRALFKLISVAVVVATVVLTLDLINLFLPKSWAPDSWVRSLPYTGWLPTTTELGQFGDFFGGVVNPIFTFLTFFGLIITIVIQRMELRLARREYSETSKALKTQAMENTFFNILDLHHKLVDGLKFDPNELHGTDEERWLKFTLGRSIGLKPFAEGRNVFAAVIAVITAGSPAPEEVARRYSVIQKRHNHVLGHYFRNLYHALKSIDSYSELTIEEKRKYASILRAQLSSNELLVLLFNCLDGVVDDGQFGNLLIEYRMLEHVPLTYVNGGYKTAGISESIVAQRDVDQYIERRIILARAVKYPKGAFGKNEQIRTDILRRAKDGRVPYS